MQFPELSLIDEDRRLRRYRPLLWILSILYGIGIRVWSFFRSVRPGRSLPGFVISVGNLTAGGTGKTPAACMLAQWARENGHRVAILSRGFKGNYKQKILVVSDGRKLLAGAAEAGDEPVLLAGRVPDVPVIVSKRRYDGGAWAYHHYGTDFFILDDGFQHRALERDLDLVLLDGNNPFGNGYLLPRGPLREPVSALRRAQALIMTRCDSRVSPGNRGNLTDGRWGKPVFQSIHVPDKIIFPAQKKTCDLDFISGKRVTAFAGIGRPGSFRETLIQLGAHIIAFKAFGDHHRYAPQEINELMEVHDKNRTDFIITTEKDWIRLEDMEKDRPELAYLTISFAILDKKDEFFDMIENKIHFGRLKK